MSRRAGTEAVLLMEVLGGMAIGVVKWFSPKKGYGFLTMDDGQEVFVHYTAIDGNGFRSLEQGEHVQFDVAQGPKGLQAAKVTRDGARQQAAGAADPDNSGRLCRPIRRGCGLMHRAAPSRIGRRWRIRPTRRRIRDGSREC